MPLLRSLNRHIKSLIDACGLISCIPTPFLRKCLNKNNMIEFEIKTFLPVVLVLKKITQSDFKANYTDLHAFFSVVLETISIFGQVRFYH